MSEERITISEAIDILVANGRSVGEAENELLGRLRSGGLQAIARSTRLEYHGSDRPIAGSGVLLEATQWTDAAVLRTRPSSFQRYDDFEVYENHYSYTALFEAEGVELFRSQIERAVKNSAAETRNRGGRHTTHDWIRAAGMLAGYVVENDYPAEASQLTDILQAWFKEACGRVPDRRDADRFVAEMYKARET